MAHPSYERRAVGAHDGMRDSLTTVGAYLTKALDARDRLLATHGELLDAFEAYEKAVNEYESKRVAHEGRVRQDFERSTALAVTLRALDAEKRLAEGPTKA